MTRLRLVAVIVLLLGSWALANPRTASAIGGEDESCCCNGDKCCCGETCWINKYDVCWTCEGFGCWIGRLIFG